MTLPIAAFVVLLILAIIGSLAIITIVALLIFGIVDYAEFKKSQKIDGPHFYFGENDKYE